MLSARHLFVALIAVALIAVGGVGAQVIRGSQVIDTPPGEISGRWVEFDKNTANPSYQRVFCLAYSEGGLSCDFADARTVTVYEVSKR